MGNLCIGREDGGRDDFAQYQRYMQLRAQVVGLLEEPNRLHAECGSSFRAACDGPGHLSQPLLIELTHQLLKRLSCDSPQTMQVVYRIFEECSPQATSVDERTFQEYMRRVLCYVERDLASKIARLQSRFDPRAQFDRLQGGAPEAPSGAYVSGAPVVVQGGVVPGGVPAARNASAYGPGVQQAPPDVRWQGGAIQAAPMGYSAPEPGVAAAPYRGQPLAGMQPSPATNYRGMQSMPGRPDGMSRDTSPVPYRGQPPGIQAAPGGMQSLPGRPGAASPLRAASPMRDGAVSPVPASPIRGMSPQREAAQGFAAPATYGGPATYAAPPSPSAANDRAPSPMLSGVPPRDAPPMSPHSKPPGPPEPEAVEAMEKKILNGELRVRVYNQRQELEVKRLAVNKGKGLIAIFGDEGKPSAWFRISDLQGISKGTAGTQLETPPKEGHAGAFTFPDGSLCVVFDSREDCECALVAFKHLCRVPISNGD